MLRTRAAERPDATFLVTPEEGRQWTYGQTLEAAERVCGGLFAAGARTGDRVLIMAANSSQLVRTWLGSAVGGLVEVPINTAYEGEFLRHQVVTVTPRWAVIDDVNAARFAAIAEHCGGIEHFWVIDTGQLSDALATLRAQGWAAVPVGVARGSRPARRRRARRRTASRRSSSPPARPARPRASRCRTPRCTSSATRSSR